MEYLPIKLLRETAMLPTRKTVGSVGYDIAACIAEDVVVAPGEMKIIGSGFAMELEAGYAAFIYARSGLGINYGIIPANCVGVIDSDYRGEIVIGLKNTSKESFTVHNGDRIAQMIIAKCELPILVIQDELNETLRGSNRFGSTGGA